MGTRQLETDSRLLIRRFKSSPSSFPFDPPDRTVEKPPKFVEKGNLEVLLFTLQSKMRANNQKPYLPKEGKTISDINRAWDRLEKAEHERELALREELIRQEKLEQLAARFDRKASMRETWLSENQRLVAQVRNNFQR